MIAQGLTGVGLGATITFPVGSYGAAKEAQNYLNSLRTGTASIVGFVPPIPDTQVTPTPLQMAIGNNNYDAGMVENTILQGQQATVNLILASGVRKDDPTWKVDVGSASGTTNVATVTAYDWTAAVKPYTPVAPVVTTPVANNPAVVPTTTQTTTSVTQSQTNTQPVTSVTTDPANSSTGIINSLIPSSISGMVSNPWIIGGALVALMFFMGSSEHSPHRRY